MRPDAVPPLSAFRDFVAGATQGRLEEVYTGTFDMDATYHPYVGYHLLGESYKRSAFLLELKERYRAQGFATSDRDLPDRLSTVLGFLSRSADHDLNQELMQDAVVPALEKMTQGPQPGEGEPAGDTHPYHDALVALWTLAPGPGPAAGGGQGAGPAGGETNG